MRQNKQKGVYENDNELMEQIKMKLKREQNLSIHALNAHIYSNHPKNKN